MITKHEKKLVHIYAHAAGLGDPEYRRLLTEHTGKRSCADPEFSHADTDRALAALEAVLFDRVDRGVVPDPRRRSRWIRDEFHFRNKHRGRGWITSRQHHKIEELWHQLSQHLPPDKAHSGYLAAIIVKATGKTDLGVTALTTHQASHLIDVLTDRLTHALRA